MADSYLTADELDQLFAAWEEEWGSPHTSPSGVNKYVFRDGRRFREACEALADTLREQHGYTLKDMSTIRDKVLKRVCPKEAFKKSSSWIARTEILKAEFIRGINDSFKYDPVPSEGFVSKATPEEAAKPTPRAPKVERPVESPAREEFLEGSETLPNRPPVPKGVGDKNPPADIVDWDLDVLAELGVKK